MFSGNCGRTACCGGKGGGGSGLLGNILMCRLAIATARKFAGSKLGECVGDAFKIRVLHDESLHSLLSCVSTVSRERL